MVTARMGAFGGMVAVFVLIGLTGPAPAADDEAGLREKILAHARRMTPVEQLPV